MENKLKLTTREREVLDLLLQRGCSNKQIARMLGICESTIKLHMGKLLKKTGAKTRTQLIVFIQTYTLV
jgi:two-component system, NarL family, nitrate/nitrite response regulator NarL